MVISFPQVRSSPLSLVVKPTGVSKREDNRGRSFLLAMAEIFSLFLGTTSKSKWSLQRKLSALNGSL